MKKPLNIALIGRSGSGKGTQAELLVRKFNLKYIETGKLLRQLSQRKNETSKRLNQKLKKGNLAPSWLVEYILVEQMIEKVKPSDGIIIDGSPRRISEVYFWDDLLNWYGRRPLIPILIDISAQEAFIRLTKRRICQKCGRLIPWIGEFKKLKLCDKCGGKLIHRLDDRPEAIKRRLAFFQKEVMPVIKYYQAKN